MRSLNSLRRSSAAAPSSLPPAARLATPSRLVSPRTPVGISSKFKSINLSPLVDPLSPLSLPESDYNRVRWLNRFTPRWNESREERLTRFKLRSQAMRTSRAHTERLLNSFQRLDAFTSTVLPSDFMISFTFSKWLPPLEDKQPAPAGKSKKKNQEDGPGIYLTPNRILHPYWVPKNSAMSIWLLCNQDTLKFRKKFRSIYRFTQEPKFSPHLSDQISSQLMRRIAQECVVLKCALAPVLRSTPTSFNQDIVDKARSGKMPMMLDYPTPSNGQTVMEYVKYLLDQSMTTAPEHDQAKPELGLKHSTALGAIIVMSSSLFQRLLRLNTSRDINSSAELETHTNQPTLMFSLSLTDGPVPVWDLHALLQIMAKQPPQKQSDYNGIANLNQTTKISNESSLAEILKKQIADGLNYSSKRPSSSQLLQDVDHEVYLIPLTELTYPLILSLRRATWWLGQGFELNHFSHIDAIIKEATDRKNKKESDWLDWLRNKQIVKGKIGEKGRLWPAKKYPSEKKLSTQTCIKS